MTTPPATGFSVSVADVASTAAAFDRIHVAAAGAVSTAAGALSGSAGMAGEDAGSPAAWRTRYDAVAGATWAACGAAVGTLHDVAAKLVETGNAYLTADHASTPGAPGGPRTLPPVAPARPVPGGPPSASGPSGGSAPPGLVEYRPGGDPARLRAAGTAWSTLADALDDGALDADRAFRALTAHNTGAGFSAMAAFWASRYTLCAGDPLFNVTPIGARTLGQVCTALADLIEHTRTTFDRAVEDAAHEFAPLEAFAPPEVLARIPLAPTRAVALVEVLGEPLLAHGFVEVGRVQYLSQLDELTRQLSPDLEGRLDRATQFPGPTDAPGVTVADVGEVAGLGLRGSGWDQISGDRPTPDSVHLTADRRDHILDGDGPGTKGGGHRHGTGKANKTEFPATGWSDEHITRSVTSIARDPNPQLEHEFQGNGNWKVQGVRDGVLIEVILRPNGHVVTAYPVSGPGVHRNPPAAK